MQKNLNKYIGVAAAIIFFLIFFGGLFSNSLPRVLTLDLFKNNVTNTGASIAGSFEEGADLSLNINTETRLEGLVEISDIKEGNGLKVERGNTVSVGYVGTYISDPETGETVEFDRNDNPETPFEFAVGAQQVIPGFEEGIIGMREGGIRLVSIDYKAAYGDVQVGPIPPKTNLTFIIELYEVQQ